MARHQKESMSSELIIGYTAEAKLHCLGQIDKANVSRKRNVNFNVTGIVPVEHTADVIIYLRSQLKKLGYNVKIKGPLLIISW